MKITDQSGWARDLPRFWGYVPHMESERAPLEPGPAPLRSHCHCTVCKQTFSAITLFDRHRRAGRCIDPRDIPGWRLVAGIWRGPAMTDDERHRRTGTP